MKLERPLRVLLILLSSCAVSRGPKMAPAHVQDGGSCKSSADCEEELECMFWPLTTPGSAGTCQRACKETSECPGGQVCGGGFLNDSPGSFCTPPGVD